MLAWIITTLVALRICASAPAPKHIVFIVADDVGYNDISLHGSPQIPTPHIDALATDGVELANYHVQPVCSPSRSSFLSARHVIHTGIYHPFQEGDNVHLRNDVTLLPQYLSRCCGFSTHMVGKWHLGANTVSTYPSSRGFDTHIGYIYGAEDHFTHTVKTAYDFSRNVLPQPSLNNTWSTRIFASEAASVIADFAPGGVRSGERMFLYLAFQDVHWPLQAPPEFVSRFINTTGGDPKRLYVAAMAAFLDEGVGNVTRALQAAGMWNETLVIFTSDNGGPTNGNENTASNNFPMRGGKNTLWEGGTRVAAVVRGAGITKSGYTSYEKLHATDWVPTLVRAASGRPWTDFISPTEPPYQLGDGVDVWESLSTGSTSPRDWLLLEAHPRGAADQAHGNALIVGDWKIIQWAQSPAEENGWHPPPGQNPNATNYTLGCPPPPTSLNITTQCRDTFCLFNVTSDPCEHHDVASQHPDVVAELVARLAAFQDTAVPQLQGDGCLPVRAPLPIVDSPQAWQPCDGPCLSDAHCNFNGRCGTDGECACAPGWVGFRCGQLDAAPPVSTQDGLFRLPASSSWGGSVIFAPEDGLFHLFYSQMLGSCGLNRWTTNSACWHAVGASPAGPFTNESQVIGAFCHNAIIRRASDDTYLLWHIGDGTEGSNVANCSSVTTDIHGNASALPSALDAQPATGATIAAGGIGFNTFAWSASVWGPWTPMGYSVINGTGIASDWDATITNVAPWPMPDGRVLLGFRGKSGAGLEQIGIASAPSWRGPYRRMLSTPVLAGTWDEGTGGEDPFLWVTADGVGHMLYHRCCGPAGDAPPGTIAGHLFTPVPNDYSRWVLSPDVPYGAEITWANGTSARLARRERPQLYFDPATGAPIVLFNGVVPIEVGDAPSFTMAQRIGAGGAMLSR